MATRYVTICKNNSEMQACVAFEKAKGRTIDSTEKFAEVEMRKWSIAGPKACCADIGDLILVYSSGA